MPSPLPTSTAGPVATADVFLAVVGKKQGALKGECRAVGHVDDINVLSWQWGMSAPTAVGSTQATRRRVHEALIVTKHLDSASTRLMNALAVNEELKSVTLSLRKAGDHKDDFFSITLEAGRVSSLHVESDGSGGVHEVVKFAFQKIEVSYQPQLTAGGLGGAQVFQDELDTTS
jgi:type VI secretion system secreted protein Hcp